ncbi:hypothetical protein Tco_0417304 [Tanacetum coccineum]
MPSEYRQNIKEIQKNSGQTFLPYDTDGVGKKTTNLIVESTNRLMTHVLPPLNVHKERYTDEEEHEKQETIWSTESLFLKSILKITKVQSLDYACDVSFKMRNLSINFGMANVLSCLLQAEHHMIAMRAVNVRHHRVGETEEPAIYRINDDMVLFNEMVHCVVVYWHGDGDVEVVWDDELLIRSESLNLLCGISKVLYDIKVNIMMWNLYVNGMIAEAKGKGLFDPNGERGGKEKVGFDNFGGGGEEIGNYGGNDRRGSSIFERGGGALAIRSMKSKDGLGGGGLVVIGGRVRVRVVLKSLELKEGPFGSRWVVIGDDKEGISDEGWRSNKDGHLS